MSDETHVPHRVQVRPATECLDLVGVAATAVGVAGVQRLVNVGDQMRDVLQGELQCITGVCPGSVRPGRVDKLISAVNVTNPTFGFKSAHSILPPVGYDFFILNKEKFKWHMV